MTSQELQSTQRKLADDIAKILREHNGSYFEQVFSEQFPGSGISDYEIKETQRKVGSILRTFRTRKMIRLSTAPPAKVSPPPPPKKAVQMSLMNIHGYPD